MIQNLLQAIEQARRIALIMHISPDGDTCGTSLALRRAFSIVGKETYVFCEDAAPKNHQVLHGADSIMPPLATAEAFDLAIAVDVGDLGRMGSCAGIFHAAKRNAQIDHHGTNTHYAEINFVLSPISATAILAARLIDELSIPFDSVIAECLYVAVASDTGNFKFHNTDPDALRLAARCLELGVDPQAVALRLFDLKPYPQMLLTAKAIESMQLLELGSVALMQLTKDDFLSSGALQEHTEGIINYARNTEGVRMACLLVEHEQKIRCNLRSLFPYDVSGIANRFGGGGHAQSSGCTLDMPLSKARQTLTGALLDEWRRNQSTGSSIS